MLSQPGFAGAGLFAAGEPLIFESDGAVVLELALVFFGEGSPLQRPLILITGASAGTTELEAGGATSSFASGFVIVTCASAQRHVHATNVNRRKNQTPDH